MKKITKDENNDIIKSLIMRVHQTKEKKFEDENFSLDKKFSTSLSKMY